MEARIREAFPDATVELIESSGGVFEIEKDGELVYSKKRTGRHAEWDEVRTRLEEGRS
jgi:selT/selW/selH-like putative selenoprotein